MIVHPRKDDYGNSVRIERPHSPSSKDGWNNPESHVTTTPDHDGVPKELNGVPFKKYPTPDTWKDVEGQGKFSEPSPMVTKNGKKKAVGVAVLEKHSDGTHRVWVVHPTNQFGGYHATLPKGTLEHGLNMHENALKEVHEESGLKAKLTGHLGDTERTTSVARYYTGERTGGHPSDMGWESQAVSLVPVKHLHKVLTHPSDEPIVKELQKRYK
jgi:ADP-ribose pyrophosphatase YjhB (NUDIX family)